MSETKERTTTATLVMIFAPRGKNAAAVGAATGKDGYTKASDRAWDELLKLWATPVLYECLRHSYSAMCALQEGLRQRGWVEVEREIEVVRVANN